MLDLTAYGMRIQEKDYEFSICTTDSRILSDYVKNTWRECRIQYLLKIDKSAGHNAGRIGRRIFEDRTNNGDDYQQ